MKAKSESTANITEQLPGISRATNFGYLRLASLFLLFNATISIIISTSAQKLPIAILFLVIGSSLKFLRIRLPRILFVSSEKWLPLIFIPLLSTAIGFLYFISGLKGGLLILIASSLGTFLFSLLLTTETLYPNASTLIRYTKRILVPFTVVFFSLALFVCVYLISNTFYAILCVSVIAILVAVSIFVSFPIHLSLLFTTSFILSVFPLLIEVPYFNYMFDGWVLVFSIMTLNRTLNIRGSTVPSMFYIYTIGFCYASWLVLSFIISNYYTYQATYKIIGSVFQLIFMFAFVRNIQSRIDIKSVVFGYIGGSLVVVVGMMKYVWYATHHLNAFTFYRIGFRLTVNEQSPNFVMVPIYISLLILSMYVASGKKVYRKSALALMVFYMILIIASGSRSYFVAGTVVGLHLAWNNPKIRKVFFSILLTIFGIYFAISLYDSYLANVAFRTNQISQGSGRLELWRNAFDLLQEHPIIGNGPFTGLLYFPKYMAKYLVDTVTWHSGRAHNIFFTESMESGVIGFLILVLIHYCIFKWVRKSYLTNHSYMALAGIYILISFFVRGMFESGEVLFTNGTVLFGYPPILAIALARSDWFIQSSSSGSNSYSQLTKSSV